MAGGGESDGSSARVDVLMIGSGEYTTGYGKESAKSDKGAGVVALVMFDLRRRGLVGRVGLCGTNGAKMPAIRAHMAEKIGGAYPASKLDLSLETFPADGDRDATAYLGALDAFRGGVATVFTPDETHFDIAMACVERGVHVLLAKPPVMTLKEHQLLAEAAAKHNVFVMTDVHKRFDPVYVDARDRIRAAGAMSFFNAYMSQPKRQLQTFAAWVGKSDTDISYYLNSHHVDFSEWVWRGVARPVRVTAMAASGVADSVLGLDKKSDSEETAPTTSSSSSSSSSSSPSSSSSSSSLPTSPSSSSSGYCIADTISLSVQWENFGSGALGVALYTSSWIAPPSDVHSQQRFFAMGAGGEVRVDQAHRGYGVATDEGGFASVNPLFMKYAPSDGKFAGQRGYGYLSFEAFIQACVDIKQGKRTLRQVNQDTQLADIHSTTASTAILEAGKRSLQQAGRPVEIHYPSPTSEAPSAIQGD